MGKRERTAPNMVHVSETPRPLRNGHKTDDRDETGETAEPAVSFAQGDRREHDATPEPFVGDETCKGAKRLKPKGENETKGVHRGGGRGSSSAAPIQLAVEL